MIELESMAVEMPVVAGHPNRAAFRGVLTVVDVASERAPAGSKGHRVVLTRAAAEAALPSLLGMALDYAPSLDRHDQRRKVGVITSAEIVGRNLEVGGYLYAKDFPEILREVEKSGRRSHAIGKAREAGQTARTAFQPLAKAARSGEPTASGEGRKLRQSLAAAVERLRHITQACRKKSLEGCVSSLRAAAGPDDGLGMSYELTDVEIADLRARVWILTQVTFTGAAILRRNRAAYEDTWIELSESRVERERLSSHRAERVTEGKTK